MDITLTNLTNPGNPLAPGDTLRATVPTAPHGNNDWLLSGYDPNTPQSNDYVEQKDDSNGSVEYVVPPLGAGSSFTLHLMDGTNFRKPPLASTAFNI